MLNVVAAVIFFGLWIYVRRQNQAAQKALQKITVELASTQQDLQKAEHRARQITGLFNALQEHKAAPNGRASWKDFADFVVQTASPFVGAETVVMLRWKPETSDFRGAAARGLAPQDLNQLRIVPGQGAIGRAAAAGKTVWVQDAASGGTPAAQENFLSAPYAIVPLSVQARVQGLLVLSSLNSRITTDQQRLTQLFAKQVELTMENLDLFETRQLAYTEVVLALTHALSAKSIGSQAHTNECGTWVREMGKAMKLPEGLIEQIEFGAILHDVGKLGIPEALLNKPGPLSVDEYIAIKKHPEIGYSLLRGISFFKGIAPIVLYHHEWVNGQGYPEGLAGEEIPLGARMLSIVDAWDAMTTDQPYRKALNRNNAVAELRQQAGTQFDPKLVDVFLNVLSAAHANA